MSDSLATRTEICLGGIILRTMLGVPTGLTALLWGTVGLIVYVFGAWFWWIALPGLVLHLFCRWRTSHDPHWLGVGWHHLRYKKDYR